MNFKVTKFIHYEGKIHMYRESMLEFLITNKKQTFTISKMMKNFSFLNPEKQPFWNNVRY